MPFASIKVPEAANLPVRGEKGCRPGCAGDRRQQGHWPGHRGRPGPEGIYRVSHVSDAAGQHSDKWGGFQDDYESLVNGIASTVAHDMSLLRSDVPTEHAGPDRSADSIPEDDQAATIRSEDTDGVSHPGDDDGGDSAAVDHSGGMVAGQGAWSGTPVTTARISDDVRPLFADGLGSEPSER